MRRDHLLIALLGATIVALLLAGAAALLAPAAPLDLLPPGATVVRVERRGFARALVIVQMPPRQNRHAVYRHMVNTGWRLRRVNVLPDDPDQNLFRRSFAGNLLEAATLQRDFRDSRTVTIHYFRCVRRLTCWWR